MAILDDKYDYQQLNEELFRISRKWIIDNSATQDAEDLTQEALIVLYRKSKTEDFILSVKPTTFLMGVVKCLWYKKLRTRNKLGPIGDDLNDIQDFCLEAIESANKISNTVDALLQGIEMLGTNARKSLKCFTTSSNQWISYLSH